MGFTLIENEEYKKLILKEKELEKSKEAIGDQELKGKELEEENIKLQKELEELILVATENRVSFYGELSGLDIEDTHLAEYLNEYYYKDGRLEFRKLKD